MSFLNYLAAKQTEQIILEISAGIACLQLDPERWLTEWVRNNYPFLEAEVVTNFNTIVMQEAWGSPSDGPFPNRGGFLSGLKNWFGSLGKGIKHGWGTAMDTPTKNAFPAGIQAGKDAFQHFRGQRTEDAFANAWKYVNALADAFEKDPRIAQAMQNPQLGQHATGIHKALGQVRQQLMDLGNKANPILQGKAPSQEAAPQGSADQGADNQYWNDRNRNAEDAEFEVKRPLGLPTPAAAAAPTAAGNAPAPSGLMVPPRSAPAAAQEPELDPNDVLNNPRASGTIQAGGPQGPQPLGLPAPKPAAAPAADPTYSQTIYPPSYPPASELQSTHGPGPDPDFHTTIDQSGGNVPGRSDFYEPIRTDDTGKLNQALGFNKQYYKKLQGPKAEFEPFSYDTNAPPAPAQAPAPPKTRSRKKSTGLRKTGTEG